MSSHILMAFNENVVTHAGKYFAHGFIKCVHKYRKPEEFEKG